MDFNVSPRTLPEAGGRIGHGPQTSQILSCARGGIPGAAKDHDRLLARVRANDIGKPDPDSVNILTLTKTPM